ncbi:MAG: FAD-dependent oxidoreductase [Thermodesulfobacteriota bacterium]
MTANHVHSEQAHHEQEIERQLKKMLADLPQDIPLVLFTRSGKNDVFSDAARQAIRFFRRLTDRITLKEFDLGHDMARRHNVTHAPTILFDPEHHAIRWLGAPIGEEGRIFLEAILLIGFGRSNLSPSAESVLQRIKAPRTVKVFVSPTCPYCPQQALNALKATVARPDILTLELIDVQANPDLAEQYSAHSVPQTYADDVLIAQGAQTEELFVSSLEKMVQQTIFIPESDAEEVETDLVIIGGGPAGLTAGIYAARSGLKSVVVEKGVLGGQVATTPIVENYPGLKQVGGKTLVDIMVTHALEYVQIFPGEEVMDITTGSPFVVQTSRRKFKTKTILLATGAVHRHLGVPGESRLSGHGVSYCSTCDGPLFAGRKVVMVGGGNSAVTEALYLKNMGAEVTLIHRGDRLKAQEILSRQLSQNDIPVLFNTEIKEIRGKHEVEEVLLHNSRTGRDTTLGVSGVFIAIGYLPATDLARKLGLNLTEDGYVVHNQYRTTIPGIYAAGDVVGGFKQIVTASGHGAGAAMTIFEDLIHPFWQKNQ